MTEYELLQDMYAEIFVMLSEIRQAASVVCAAARASDDDTSAPDLHAAIEELGDML